MRLSDPLNGQSWQAWAMALLRDLRGVLGSRRAAGIAVGTVELSTGTSTDVATPAAVPGRYVILQAANSSAVTANTRVLPVTTAGSFEILHAAGEPGRVVAWVLV